MGSRMLSVAAAVFMAALSFGTLSAKEVAVAKRFVEHRTYLQVNVRAGIQTLILQRKDVKSREWVDHARISVQGPLKKYRVPVPEGYDRKTKWRFRGSTDAVSPPDNPSPEPGDPAGTPSHVFPGLVLDRFDVIATQQPSATPPASETGSLWKMDKLKLVPGYLFRLDDAASKIVVTSDQNLTTVLAEKPLGEGRPVKMAVEGSHLYVLRIKGHTLVNNRVLNSSDTPDPLGQAPTYAWDVYDISSQPTISTESSTEFGLEVSAGIASLLQKGGVDASIVFPKPGIAAVLINHTAWIADRLSYLPEGIPAVRQGIPNTQSSLVYTGYNGTNYGPSESSRAIPSSLNTDPYKTSQRRSCPLFVVIDCRNPQVPQISDPMFVGDRRTVRSTPLFSADGVVGFGYETIESLPSPWVRNSVRSYLQVLTVGDNGTVVVKPLQDLPGRLRAVEEFTADRALVWTTTFHLYGDQAGGAMNAGDAQVSLYENGGVTMQAVAVGIDSLTPAILGREMFANSWMSDGYTYSIARYQFTNNRNFIRQNVGVGGKTLSTYFDALRLGDEIFGLSYDTGGRSWNSTLYSLWNGVTANSRSPIPISYLTRNEVTEWEFSGNTLIALFNDGKFFKFGFD